MLTINLEYSKIDQLEIIAWLTENIGPEDRDIRWLDTIPRDERMNFHRVRCNAADAWGMNDLWKMVFKNVRPVSDKTEWIWKDYFEIEIKDDTQAMLFKLRFG